jgi:hypothetical protein
VLPAARGPVRFPVSLKTAIAGLVVFILGVLLGVATGGPDPAPARAAPSSTVTVTATTPSPREVAPPACLAAIRQGDAVIRLLGEDNRHEIGVRRLGELLKSYTVAAQTCRKEASRR